MTRIPSRDRSAESAPQRAAGFFPWPGLVFVLIGLNVAIVAVTVWASTGDPSFAVDARYDVKAAQWQLTADQRAASAALGWSLEVVEPTIGEPLRMRLSDREGAPLSAARIDVLAFHHAEARRRLNTTALEASDGVYGGDLVLDRPGRWRLEAAVTRGVDRFVTRLDLEVPGVPSAIAPGIATDPSTSY